MTNRILIALFSAALYSCTATPGPVSNTTGNDTSTVTRVDSPVVETNPFADSLRAYFADPCDFYALKKKTMHMHSGNSPDMVRGWYHTTNDPHAELYCYWAIEFDLRNKPVGRSLLFATQKPWNTQAQRSYENDNETLVGIRCCIAWEELGPSDFVGMHIDSVRAKFGEPHAIDDRYSNYENTAGSGGPKDKINTTSVYFQDDHLLLLNEKNKKVNWFKYYWWHQDIESVDSLPDPVFEWQ